MTASGVFLIFTSRLYQFLVRFPYLHYFLTRLKYSFLNTPKWQNLMLLTSGGYYSLLTHAYGPLMI